MGLGTGQGRSWRELRRNNPVLVRMGYSYAALVLIVAVTLSGFSYLFFQQKYDQELEALHRVLLENMHNEIRSEVLDMAKSVYMTLAMDVVVPSGAYFSAQDQREGNAEKLYWTYRQLSELVTRHSPAVRAIHLYFHKSQLFVSSERGVKYEIESTESTRGRQWRDQLIDRGKSALWIGADEGSLSENSITALQVYPILEDPGTSELVVAIEFRVETVRAILDRFTGRMTGNTLLVDPKGRVITVSTGAAPWSRDLVVKALAEPPARQRVGFAETIQGVPSLVTVLPVEGSDWFLVNGTPLAQLHQKDAEIFLVLILISLAVVLLGLGIAIPLVFRLYSPLERLATRVRGLFGTSGAHDGTADEYGMIDQAIEGLSATLRANRPVIKHEFVSRLLDGGPVDHSDFDETLKLLEVKGFPSVCRAGNLRLLEGGWVAKYRLLEELENRGGPLTLITPMPGPDLGLVVDASEISALGTLAQGWVDLALEVCGTAVCVCFGKTVDSPFELGASYDQARRLLEFRFFHPETSVFFDRDDLLIDGGPLALPEQVLQDLTEALRLRQSPLVDQALDEVVRFVQTPGVTPERGRHELYRVTRALGQIVSTSRVATADAMLQRLEGLLADAADLHEWRDSVAALAFDLFAQLENRAEDRNAVLVERVRVYVAEHLAGELSLNRVSSSAGISPSYLSKVFKDVTGTNFVSFVTEERLKEAARLLQESRATTQEIGRLVGFNTPAYFIHQFRGRFGVTPYEYRRNLPEAPAKI